MTKRAYLNLGCGDRYNKDWINVDLAARDSVLRHDLRKPLPFEDNRFDLVYHSHVLEHFERTAGGVFLKECLRVLRPGGILRVVVPDLAGIASAYLEQFHKVRAGASAAKADHRWMIIELIDQMVRNRPGGEMLKYLGDPNIANADFVVGRIGAEGRRLLHRSSDEGIASSNVAEHSTQSATLVRNAVLNLSPLRLLRRLRRKRGRVSHLTSVAIFRESGETHQWMYDEVSLSDLLEATGFVLPTKTTATKSAEPRWATFHLDTESDGSVRKPDSLFMEAYKP